jgi:hypothetical protein
MDSSRSGPKRRLTSVRLLLAAGAALAVAVVGVWVYPHLVAAGTDSMVLAILRTVVVACVVAVFALPIVAIVRRLTR